MEEARRSGHARATLRAATDALRRTIRAAARASPRVKRFLVKTELAAGLVEHTLARAAPIVIQPRPRRITIAITAHCNLRCIGCRYGRDFMVGKQLTLGEVRDLLDDARAAGVELVRLYGGEPLLHRDLPEMVRHSVRLGLATYITTNGLLLRQKIDALYDAGLRNITIGFYGTGDAYDRYVGRSDRFTRLTDALTYVRERYGSALSLQLNYLVMRPSCSRAALEAAWGVAERFDMTFHTDLIHYSLPYFTDGTEGDLKFTPDDLPAIRRFVAALGDLKRRFPTRVRESLASIHSIPDWLLKGPEMRVPCDARNLVWVGADGSVQLCYVTFRLGNIRDRPLREMLFTQAHRDAARDAFRLNCPTCHCERDSRVMKDLASRFRYASAPPSG